MRQLLFGLSVAALLAAAPVASAGPVVLQSGQVVVTFDTAAGGPSRRTFDLALPGTGTVAWNGAADETAAVGEARTEYDVAHTEDGATVHVTMFTRHDGPPATSGSAMEVVLSFTTDRAMRFHLEGDPSVGPGGLFGVQLDDLSAKGEVTIHGGPVVPSDIPIWFGDARGVWDFGLLVREGVLEAGEHMLTLQARAGISRTSETEPDGGPPLGSSTLGRFDLVLTPADAAAIPLPAAAWPGLALLGGIITNAARNRRAAA
jgi:hypothetical protein